MKNEETLSIEEQLKDIQSRPTLTFTKKVKNYVLEESLKDLCEAAVIESYEIKRFEDGTEVTITIMLEPNQNDRQINFGRIAPFENAVNPK
jgi:hypothetical protein